MSTLTQILNHKIVAIIRGAQTEDVLKIANALSEGGVKIVEVTLNSPNALSAIKEISTQLGSEILVGAGTVLNAEMANAAMEAGAQFIISPSLDIDTIKATKQNGAVSIPGAFTATEILAAYTNGGDIIKVFPASVGSAYFKDIRGPFPHIPLMPTGGISLTNIQDFQRAGAVAFGIGSALVDTSHKITYDYLKVITGNAKKLVDVLSR